MSAIWGMEQILSGERWGPEGGIALFWNSSAGLTTSASAVGLNPEVVNLGVSAKQNGNVFFGLWTCPHTLSTPSQRPSEQAGSTRSPGISRIDDGRGRIR